MLSLIGNVLITLAILSGVFQIVRPLSSGDRFVKNVTLATQISPFLFLSAAFIIEASTLDLVSRYVGDGLPLAYRISAVWGSRSGPLLLWAALLGLVTWVMSRNSDSASIEVRIMHGWTSAILIICFIMRPFRSSQNLIGGELNPLLQTDLMVVHPPLVFGYYSLCLATASIGIAGLIRDEDPEKTHENLIQWARYSFVIGTLGIGLGGLWAYTVLDWGGYWAWDPVETGSLLPWIGLLAIIHARARPGKVGRFSSTPALAMIVGALTMHATLVTRANGVWYSVHAFVADGQGSMASDPYLRIMQIVEISAVGLEVATYLFFVVMLGFLAFLHLFRQQAKSLEASGKVSLFEKNRILAFSVVLFYIIIGFWIGSSAVLVVGLAFLILLVFGDYEDPPAQWVASGVILMVISTWAWVADWQQSMIGMIPFILIWLLPEEGDDINLLDLFKDAKKRYALARAVPWFVGLTFLMLTWLLLTVEIDSTNLVAHELYGAPMIALLGIGLTFYAWGPSMSSARGSTLFVLVLLSSIVLSIYSDSLILPGDPDLPVVSGIDRGGLSMFILAWLVFAIPPTVRQLWKTSKKVIPVIREKGPRSPKVASRVRTLSSHVSHLGIILLLVGHVLTTTLVSRSDPSHLVTLVKDQPISHRGYEMTFTDVEIISSYDRDYDFGIGDGYVGVVIEISRDGEYLGELMPGMLRFDSPSGLVSARSEVDRLSLLTGDIIVILDVFQSNDLLDSMFMGDTSEVDRVRVTVHELQGSHLVWMGWIMVLAGGIINVIPRNDGQEDE